MRGEAIAPQPKPAPKLLAKRKQDAQLERTWWKTRRVVLERDGHRCRACSQSHGLDVHHVIARSLGGTNDKSNLITLCRDCHASVHGHVLVLRWHRHGEPAKTVRFIWVR